MIKLPIPGQSLTDTPKNAPYENPPQITNPEEAIQAYMTKLSNPDAMEEIMFLLELGMDIVSLVEGITRSGVMSGVHSVDMSLIVAPVVHELIKQTADSLDVEYDEGFENKEAKKRQKYSRNAALAKKMMEKAGVTPKEVAKEVDMAEVEAMVEEQSMQEPAEAMMEEPKGLMARRA